MFLKLDYHLPIENITRLLYYQVLLGKHLLKVRIELDIVILIFH